MMMIMMVMMKERKTCLVTYFHWSQTLCWSHYICQRKLVSATCVAEIYRTLIAFVISVVSLLKYPDELRYT